MIQLCSTKAEAQSSWSLSPNIICLYIKVMYMYVLVVRTKVVVLMREVKRDREGERFKKLFTEDDMGNPVFNRSNIAIYR